MVAQVDAKSVTNNQVVELITAGRSGELGNQQAEPRVLPTSTPTATAKDA
jgi:hypothetical protein